MKSCRLIFVVATVLLSSAGWSQVKNVIFMIGDGMGLAHVSATMLSQDSVPMALERAQYVGLAKTHSGSSKVTDSAAAGTALATGTKTYNGAIGVDMDKRPLATILERSEAKGLATGVVVTYPVTNATPAAFVAHVESRKMEQEIALDYLKTGIDVFVGGGRDMFEKRDDGRNLSDELRGMDYRVVYTLDDFKDVKSGKVAGLLAPMSLPKMSDGRGDYLPQATVAALGVLGANNPEGFFVMVEGSMIDGGGHANNIDMIVAETVDFDRAVGCAFDFADRHPGTLVIVTADHETGGLSLPEDADDKRVTRAAFSTLGHSGSLVPVYAYGECADRFAGVMDNTDIARRIAELLGLE